MKYYNAFGIFYFRLWKLSFYLIHLVDSFAHKLYLSNTHKLHGSWLGVLYAWMNGYSTLLYNIAPGKYIVIKVEYGLQLRNKNNHLNAYGFGLKNTFTVIFNQVLMI